MTYNSETTNNQERKKNYRGLIYTLLIAALLGTWGYILYDKSKTKETVQQLQTQITTEDNSRIALQQQFDAASLRFDSLTSSHVKLQGDLVEKDKKIRTLQGNIAGILKKRNATNAELADAKKMIDELNGKIEGLYADVEKLKQENQVLTTSNQQLTTDKTLLQDTLAATTSEKNRLADVGSTLHASNINIAAIDIKNSGKEKVTSTAKKADLLRVSFNLDENRISASGEKNLYVVVTAPDGTPISKGEVINTRDDGEKKYTEKVLVNYEQGKPSNVSFDWKMDDGTRFQTGDYKIEIYQNGFKIGESGKSLKKAGLFASM